MGRSLKGRSPQMFSLDMDVSGGSMPAGLGQSGDLCLVRPIYAGGNQVAKKQLWLKDPVLGWQMLCTLPGVPDGVVVSSASASGNVIAPANVASMTFNATGDTTPVAGTKPWRALFSGSDFGSASSRFLANSTAFSVAQCGVVATGAYQIPPSPLMYAAIQISTLPTEANGLAGLCISDSSMTYGVMLYVDKNGAINLAPGVGTGYGAGGGSVVTANSVFTSNNMLVLIRNGPLFSGFAFNTSTGVKKPGSDVAYAVTPYSLNGAWSANPGMFFDATTTARMSNFQAVA